MHSKIKHRKRVCDDLLKDRVGGAMDYQILIIVCILALIAVIMNLRVLEYNVYPVLKIIVSVMVSFTALRYVTLIVYGDSPDYQLLNALRYFYLASSIGIPLTTVSALWYVTPCYREKIQYPYFLACFFPWIIFYLYILIKQPTKIVQGIQFGYQLRLTGEFTKYLSVAQGCFVGVIIILCGIGIVCYKHLQMRTQLFIIILAQLLLALDGFNYSSHKLWVIQPFTLTEGFALVATYYAFSVSIKSLKPLKNQS